MGNVLNQMKNNIIRFLFYELLAAKENFVATTKKNCLNVAKFIGKIGINMTVTIS